MGGNHRAAMGRSPRSIVVVWGLALVRPVICICLVGELFTKCEGATTGAFITGKTKGIYIGALPFMRESATVYAWITNFAATVYAWITLTIHRFLWITSNAARYRLCVPSAVTCLPSSWECGSRMGESVSHSLLLLLVPANRPRRLSSARP